MLTAISPNARGCRPIASAKWSPSSTSLYTCESTSFEAGVRRLLPQNVDRPQQGHAAPQQACELRIARRHELRFDLFGAAALCFLGGAGVDLQWKQRSARELRQHFALVSSADHAADLLAGGVSGGISKIGHKERRRSKYEVRMQRRSAFRTSHSSLHQVSLGHSENLFNGGPAI